MPDITPNPTPQPTPGAPAPTPDRSTASNPPSNPSPDLQDQGTSTQHSFLSLLRSHHFNFLAATATLSDAQLDALAEDPQLLTRIQSLSALAQSCFTLQAIAARSTSLHTLTPLAQSTAPAPELRRTAEALTRASNLRSLAGCHQSAAPRSSTPPHAPSRRDWCDRPGAPLPTKPASAPPEIPIPPPTATPDPTLEPSQVIQTLVNTLTNPDNPASTASTLAAFSTPTTTLNSRRLIPTNSPSPARAILDAAYQPLKLLTTTKATRPVDALQLHTYHIDPSGHPTHYASRTIGITLADNTERRLLITLILRHDADPPNAWRLDALTLLPHPPNTS